MYNISDKTKKDIIKHATLCYPYESCGFIIDDKYYPQINIADSPIRDFKIADRDYIKYHGKIDAVVHSHINCEFASGADFRQQACMDIPWLIFNINEFGELINIVELSKEI